MIKRLLLYLVILAFGLPMWAGSVKISVSPARGKRVIDVGEMFYINIQVEDIDAAPEKPSEVPGARLMYFERTGQSSSFTSVNGKTTQSFSYTYTATMRALKEGNYSFGPISVGGVKSNKLSYSIGSASGVSQNQSSATSQTSSSDKPKYIGKGDGNLFLKASVANASPFEQQAVVYTVKLYTTYDAIKFIGASAAPKFDGFVVEESKDISSSLSYETYQGKTYATAIIARYIIYPQMTGKLKITGNTYTMSVDQREYFHDPFFGNMSYATPLQLNVTPNDLTVDVKPLPEPRPIDFSGGVGSFKITSELKSQNLKTNEPASVVYRISGTGNIKYVQMPDLAVIYPAEIEVSSPSTTQNVKVSGSNTSGYISYDYSVMPLEEGTFRIPSVKLVYFNPETRKYESSEAAGFTVQVGRGSGSAKSQTAKRVKFVPDMQNVRVSALSKTHIIFVNQWWYWMIFILPITVIVVFYAVIRRYNSLHADMVAFKSQRANKIARRRLKRAELEMNKNHSEQFYTELLKALWGYISDKMKMPTSELMRDNIRQTMISKGIPEQETDNFIEIIDEAEFAKYSSAKAASSMQEIYDRAVALINSIENLLKKNKD